MDVDADEEVKECVCGVRWNTISWGRDLGSIKTRMIHHIG